MKKTLFIWFICGLATHLCLVMFMASPSNAAILWNQITTFGNFEQLTEPFYPPTKDYIDLGIAIPRSSNIFAFDERQNVTLPRNIKIAKQNPSYIEVEAFANYDIENLSDTNLAYDWDADLDTMPELEAGLTVNSHFIALYRLKKGGFRQDVAAMITFDTPIIGLIDSRDSALTNDLFSLTQYENPPNQTLEGLQWTAETEFSGPDYLETRDYVKITGEYNNILELRWSSWGYEGLRVLTQADDTFSRKDSNQE